MKRGDRHIPAGTKHVREFLRTGFLIAVFLVLPFGVSSGHSVAISLAFITVFCLAAAPRSHALVRVDRTRLLLCAFVLWAGLTAIWSLSPSESLERLGKLFVLLFAVVILFRSPTFAALPDRRQLQYALLSGLMVAALIAIAESASHGWLFEAAGLRPHNPDPNVVKSRLFRGAGLLAVMVWCLVPMLMQSFGRYVTWAFACGCAGIVVWIGVAASILGFGAAGLAFGLTWLLRAHLITALQVVTAGILLLLPAVRLLVESPFLRLLSALQSADVTIPLSAIHRGHVYDFVLDKIIERPLAGWGVDASRFLPGADDRVPIPGLKLVYLPSHPHNAALEIWVETGAVGAVLATGILWLLLGAIKRRFVEWTSLAAAAAAFAAFLSVSMISWSIWSTWWLSTAIITSFMFLSMYRIESAVGTETASKRRGHKR